MNPVFIEIVVGVALIIVSGFFNRWMIRRDRIVQLPQDLSFISSDIKDNLERLVTVEKELMRARINIATILGRINGTHWEKGDPL
jgi:hypothetical protein